MPRRPGRTPVILSIDQGTTNSKAALIGADGVVLATASAPVGISTPHPGWVEQDPVLLWESVLTAIDRCLTRATDVEIVGIGLSTQRESILGWRASTGAPLGPLIGWQDRRTAAWCEEALDSQARRLVQEKTGLRVDAMFSAPKVRWVLDHAAADVPLADVRIGTVDSWLVWNLTGGKAHRCEAGNASRTLLYDVHLLDWSPSLLAVFGVPATVLPTVVSSDSRFGVTDGISDLPDGIPIVAVLADSHAALFGHGCTEVGMAKATYGTGSSVMTPIAGLPSGDSPVPATLAWVAGGVPTFALEGNILSSGATLAWAADLLTAGRVSDLMTLASTVPDSEGVTLVPAFSGLGAPHWDRNATAIISGMSPASRAAHVARAAVDAVSHQICDIVDVIQATTAPLRVFRADGGATASEIVVQTQADLLGRDVDVSNVAEVSALGAAKLAWQALGYGHAWPQSSETRRFSSTMNAAERERQRARWAEEVLRARLQPGQHRINIHQQGSSP